MKIVQAGSGIRSFKTRKPKINSRRPLTGWVNIRKVLSTWAYSSISPLARNISIQPVMALTRPNAASQGSCFLSTKSPPWRICK
ncbi:MAG: hypothetical protein IT316_07165 [Anaerolineales bacterium]|nr:hypothetical protein [Anaerolineales bacterium]